MARGGGRSRSSNGAAGRPGPAAARSATWSAIMANPPLTRPGRRQRSDPRRGPRRTWPPSWRSMDVLVRLAAVADRADGLLYESARPYYNAFTGSEARARAVLGGLWERGGHTASWEICTIATAGEQLVGVLAGYPVADGDRLA